MVVVDLMVSYMGVALGLEIGHTRAVDSRIIETEGCLGQCNGAAEEGVVDCTRNYLYRSVGRMLEAQILCMHLVDYCAANNQSFLLAIFRSVSSQKDNIPHTEPDPAPE